MTNVLIYIVDALRADHLSCYGYHRNTTPAIDALADDPHAVRFTAAFSPSTWTKPVAASLLTGCYPPAHGVRTRLDLFTRASPRLPALLQSAGYRTLGVSAIGNVSSPMGFGLGFDRFVDLYKEPALASRRQVSNPGAWKLAYEGDVMVVLPLAEDVNEAALAWLQGVTQAADRRPWFMFLWALDPHDPYLPPPGFDRWCDPAYRGRIDGSSESVRRVRSRADVQRLLDLYDGEIAYTDQQLGVLLEALRSLGLYDDTLIAVMGDHGEAFGDHGDFVHGHLAYDEVMRVPLVIKFPARVPVPAGASDILAQLTDVAPTVLDALGLGHLSAGMQGYSLLPPLRRTQPPRAVVYAETQASTANNRLLAVRTERWKLLEVEPPGDYSGHGGAPPQPATLRQRLAGYLQQLANPDMVKKVLRNPMFYVRRQMAERSMLFDLAHDPHERENVAARHPQVVQELRAMLDAWLVEGRVYAGSDEGAGVELGLDEETLRQLQGLGYL